ncbi:MAG: hypothetical protein ABUK01_01005 [Leptospirales bacterium]
MYEEMSVKFLHINMKYRSYVTLQTAIVIAFAIIALACLFYTRDSPVWVLKNGWWLFSLGAVFEFGETILVINKAKKEFDKNV